MPNISSRLESKLLPPDDNGCRVFVGSTHEDGYGCISYNGKSVGAHRVAYMLGCGEQTLDFLQGDEVCHHCDNPPCCTFSHLFRGVHAKNMEDMRLKKRQDWAKPENALKMNGTPQGLWSHPNPTSGVKNGRAKFTSEQVREMRTLHPQMSYQQIADLYGCSLSVAWNIVRGNTYKEVMPNVS